MRFLIIAVLVLCRGLCLAEGLPHGNIKNCLVSNEQALALDQAGELVTDFEGDLRLKGLTSIDKNVAKELAKAKGICTLKS